MKRGMGDGDVILKKKEELTSEEKLGAGPGEKPEQKEYREHTEKDGGGQVRYCRKCGKKAEEKIFGG